MKKYLKTSLFALASLYASSVAYGDSFCSKLIPLLDPSQDPADIATLFRDYESRKSWLFTGPHYTLAPARTKTFRVDLTIDSDGFDEKTQNYQCIIPTSWELELSQVLTPVVPSDFKKVQSPSGSPAVPFVGGWQVYGGLAINNPEFGKSYAGIAWQMDLLDENSTELEAELKAQYPYLRDLKVVKNELSQNEAHDSVIAVGFKTNQDFPWFVRRPSPSLEKIAFPWVKDSGDLNAQKDPFLFLKTYKVLDLTSLGLIEPTSPTTWSYSQRYCPQGVCSVKESRYQVLQDIIESAQVQGGGYDVTLVFDLKGGRAAVGEYHFDANQGISVKSFKVYDHLFEANMLWLMDYRSKP